ncbi:MAG: DUF3050 domain-containing protein [Candidatus Iainarchaeum archaeon]|uniref:DUF3050 domain-containing protein n=1 Tax=Candidatus Iainarchaeum sp. TaxID=3101447 RepID=A0A7T9I1J6_9ARCH|nr:MAG: DUF3050 domain-containing protein [Candidatus Diapherotrites archaeon]
MLPYQRTIQQITLLPWEKLDEKGFLSLMVLSAFNALEFAASLRIAISLYPKDKDLAEMARGELQTNNLAFGDYKKRGDHAEFLWHFIEKHQLECLVDKEVFAIGKKYTEAVNRLPKSLRAMSIFSREDVLSPIFARIIQSMPYKTPPLKAYEYYLRRHIYLDSSAGGHRDLTSNFALSNVLGRFYRIRLQAYQALFKHFSIATK